MKYIKKLKSEQRDPLQNADKAAESVTINGLIADYGRTLLKLQGLTDFDLCRFIAIIEDIRSQDNYQSGLQIQDSFNNKEQTYKIRLKKHFSITDEKIARSLGLTPQGFRKRKKKIIKWLNNFKNHLRETKVSSEQNN